MTADSCFSRAQSHLSIMHKAGNVGGWWAKGVWGAGERGGGVGEEEEERRRTGDLLPAAQRQEHML